jgi:hypothetical protein
MDVENLRKNNQRESSDFAAVDMIAFKDLH